MHGLIHIGGEPPSAAVADWVGVHMDRCQSAGQPTNQPIVPSSRTCRGEYLNALRLEISNLGPTDIPYYWRWEFTLEGGAQSGDQALSGGGKSSWNHEVRGTGGIGERILLTYRFSC